LLHLEVQQKSLHQKRQYSVSRNEPFFVLTDN
jgi:hypothetical protein